MEFLKALQEALTMGLTKEEFSDIWKCEITYKMAMKESNQVKPDVSQEERQRVKNYDSGGSFADRDLLKGMLDLQREEYKQILSNHFKDLLEQQEHRWKEIQFKSDKMLEEIRYRLELLSSHVSNATDSNASSVKLHFMQEIELLKHDLGKSIKENSTNNKSGPSLPYLQNQSNVLYYPAAVAQANVLLEGTRSHVQIPADGKIQASTIEPKISAEGTIQAAIQPKLPVNSTIQAGIQPKIPANGTIQAGFQPKIPAEDTIQAGIEPKIPANGTIQAGIRPKIPAEGTIQAGIQPKISAEGKIQAAIQPKLPVNGTIQAAVQPKLPVNGTIQAAIQPKIPASGTIKSGIQPKIPVNGTIQAGIQPKIPANGTIQAGFQPKIPAEDTIQAGIEPKIPANGTIQAGIRPKIPAEGTIQAGIQPKISAEGKIQAAIQPKLPVNGTIQAAVQPKLPVNGTIQAAIQPKIPASGTIKSGIQPKIPVNGTIQAGIQPKIPANGTIQAGIQPKILAEDTIQAAIQPKIPVNGTIQAGIQPKIPANRTIQAGIQSKIPANGTVQAAIQPKITTDGKIQDTIQPKITASGTIKSGIESKLPAEGTIQAAIQPKIPTDGNIQTATTQTKVPFGSKSQYTTICTGSAHSFRENKIFLGSNPTNLTSQPDLKQFNWPETQFESDTQDKHFPKLGKETKTPAPTPQRTTDFTKNVKRPESVMDEATLSEGLNDQTNSSKSKEPTIWFRDSSLLKTVPSPSVAKPSDKDSSVIGLSDWSSNELKANRSENTFSDDYFDHSSLQLPGAKNSSLPEGDHEFTVKFPDNMTNRGFMSPFFYSSGKECRFRVFITINQTGALSFCLRVSKGAHDDDHKWPVELSGQGFVYHCGSHCLTPIWQLPAVICPKPLQAKEFVFQCEARLCTSRKKFPNVNYSTLVERKFAVDQKITFKTVLSLKEK